MDNVNDQEQKKLLSFDNRVCHANIVAGRASEYLDSLQKELESAPDEDLAAIAEKFPRGGAAGILDKHPELCPTFERMALKFAARGIETPVNVLWVHLFVSGKEAAAEKLWNEFLAGKPRIMFQRVLQVARERGDVGLVHALLARLQGAAISEGALGNAYSCLVDILNSQEKFDESLISLDSAVKEVCLENLNRTALIRLQEGLAKQGKPFPYTIPSKNAKSSSSSSSSDDEAKPKRKVI